MHTHTTQEKREEAQFSFNNFPIFAIMLSFVGRQTINVVKNLTINPAVFVRTLKNEVKIKWHRPEPLKGYGVERSGDLGQYEEPDQSNICLQYQYSTELEE